MILDGKNIHSQVTFKYIFFMFQLEASVAGIWFLNGRRMSKLRDELLCVFDSVFMWKDTQRFLKSFVKC